MSTSPTLSLLHPARLVSTWFGVGLSPVAPGTVGSLVALPLGFIVFLLPGATVLTLFAAALVCFGLGWWSSAVYVRRTAIIGIGREDPSEIVIDEVAGQLFALALVMYAVSAQWLHLARIIPHELIIWSTGGPLRGLLLVYIAISIPSFLLFRLFDIAKPWPISWCDRRIKGGLGVMVDDMVAGLAAGLASIALLALV